MSGPYPKYLDPRARSDGPSDRGLGGDLARVPRPVPGRAARGSDNRPRARLPSISSCPPSCGLRVPLRWVRGPRLVLLALRGGPRHSEPATTTEPTRHLGAVCVDAQPNCGVSLPRGTGGSLGHRLTGSGLDRVPPRHSREPDRSIRGTLPRTAVRRGVPGLPRIPPSVDPAAAAASEMNGHVHARVRSRRQRPNRSGEHTPELQSQANLVIRLLLGKKKKPTTE